MRDVQRQLVSLPAIIGIDECKILAAGMTDAGVARPCQAAVADVVDDANARVSE